MALWLLSWVSPHLRQLLPELSLQLLLLLPRIGLCILQVLTQVADVAGSLVGEGRREGNPAVKRVVLRWGPYSRTRLHLLFVLYFALATH